MLDCLYVGLGGFLGALCRYWISLLPLRPESGFPLATLIINVLGAFVIGLIAAAVEKYSGIDPRSVLFLKTGLCGAFTTFSTFSLETEELLRSGRGGTAAVYVVISVALCLLAVFAARMLLEQ
jgi:fluoride exporter